MQKINLSLSIIFFSIDFSVIRMSSRNITKQMFNVLNRAIVSSSSFDKNARHRF